MSETATAMLEAMVAKLGVQDLPSQTVDVSQSLGRRRFPDFTPTITPSAKIVIGNERRLLSPI